VLPAKRAATPGRAERPHSRQRRVATSSSDAMGAGDKDLLIS